MARRGYPQFGDVGLAVDLAKNDQSTFYSGSANFPRSISLIFEADLIRKK